MKDAATKDQYLWNGSGEPDPEIVRLESILSTLRHTGVFPALPSRKRVRLRWSVGRVAGALTAAAVLLLLSGAWYMLGLQRDGWAVQSLAGAPVLYETLEGGAPANGLAAGQTRQLGIGRWLVTDGASRARVDLGRVGRVDVEPNTRVQLVRAGGQEHRMSLARGTIHARIWAPPRFFYVNTPSAVAIDLGCEYTLQVDDSGAGLVRVMLGWVAFQGGDREAFIPAGAICATRPGAGPGTPRYDDAPSGYGEALDLLDFGAGDLAPRAAALDLVLSSARRRDALTLWHLLSRGTGDERARVYERLSAIAPPPSGVTWAAVLAGDQASLNRWWDSLGSIDSAPWWRLWKKKKL